MLPNNKSLFPIIPKHYTPLVKTFNIPKEMWHRIAQYYYKDLFQNKQNKLSSILLKPCQLSNKGKNRAMQSLCDSHENSDTDFVDNLFNDTYIAYYHYFQNNGFQIYSPNFFAPDTMMNCCEDQFPCFTYYRGIEYATFFPETSNIEHLWCHNCHGWTHIE